MATPALILKLMLLKYVDNVIVSKMPTLAISLCRQMEKEGGRLIEK